MKKVNVNELIQMLEKYNFKEFHLHHTLKPNKKDFNGSNHITLQQNMKRYHINTRKFSDIAQHITLFPDGLYVTGRPFNVMPASIKGWNGNKPLMLEMIGDFDKGREVLEGPQKESLLILLRYFLGKYGYNSLKFHREGPGAGKSCPGTSLNKQTLINEVKQGGYRAVKTFIGIGQEGDDVRKLQHQLNAFGWDAGAEDGIAGKQTDKAIRNFQRAHALSVDGKFGKSSYAVLKKAIDKREASASKPDKKPSNKPVETDKSIIKVDWDKKTIKIEE